MANLPIAVQLYSVRDETAKNLPDTLEAVAKMGYAGVEFAGFFDYAANDLRKLLDDNGLKVCGAHVGIDLLLGDKLAETAAYHQALGNKNLIVPGLPREYTDSKAAWLKTADTMNGIAEKLKATGQKTGYHNHHTEFIPFDGEMPWDTFFSNTNQDVIMQLDTGNALHGGVDGAVFLSRYPHRAITVHLKEYSTTNEAALIGEGDVNWQEIFTACETVGSTEWYVVEYEDPAYPSLEAIDRCLQNLRKMGK